MNGNLVYGATITGLLLLVGHWAPKPRRLGPRLSRLANYSYGVASILVGAAIWLLPGQWQTLLGLIVLALVAGAVTTLAHGIDNVLNMAVRLQVAGDECHE